jgi:hypothetical protein
MAVRHAPVSNAHVAIMPASPRQAAYNVVAAVNVLIFGIAPAFANAIAPSQASIPAQAARRPEGSR